MKTTTAPKYFIYETNKFTYFNTNLFIYAMMIYNTIFVFYGNKVSSMCGSCTFGKII